MKARRIGQVIVALLAWALFGYHWYLVTQRRFGSSTLEALQLLLTLVLVIWAVTTLWVHHNRWHFANRPDRRVRRSAGVEMGEHDALGQRVLVDGSADAIKDAGYLVIDIDPGTREKTFRVAEVPDEEAVA